VLHSIRVHAMDTRTATSDVALEVEAVLILSKQRRECRSDDAWALLVAGEKPTAVALQQLLRSGELDAHPAKRSSAAKVLGQQLVRIGPWGAYAQARLLAWLLKAPKVVAERQKSVEPRVAQKPMSLELVPAATTASDLATEQACLCAECADHLAEHAYLCAECVSVEAERVSVEAELAQSRAKLAQIRAVNAQMYTALRRARRAFLAQTGRHMQGVELDSHGEEEIRRCATPSPVRM